MSELTIEAVDETEEPESAEGDSAEEPEGETDDGEEDGDPGPPPELPTEPPAPKKTVDPNLTARAVAATAQAVGKQQAEINELKQRVEAQEKRKTRKRSRGGDDGAGDDGSDNTKRAVIVAVVGGVLLLLLIAAVVIVMWRLHSVEKRTLDAVGSATNQLLENIP